MESASEHQVEGMKVKDEATLVAKPGDPGPQPSRPRRRLFRLLVTAAIVCYTVALGVLFIAMETVGERFWPLAVLLYIPQRAFLLPLIVLIPAALLAEVATAAWVMLAASVAIFFWHVPFYPGIHRGGGGPVQVKVMTNNYDDNGGLPLEPFIDAEDPDFVALEDAGDQGPAFQHSYPERNVVTAGQFLFMSKVRIRSVRLLNWPRWGGDPVAAVFYVPWKGEELALYVIHLPTPRGDFARLVGSSTFENLAGNNWYPPDNMSFSQAMNARVQLARDLSGLLAREQRPFVALGDFNMPSQGYVHRVLAAGLTDCFQQAGPGFGFTFPCNLANPLTLGGPWLRIDYVMAGPGWHVEDCLVEPARRSEHRAVAATLSRD